MKLRYVVTKGLLIRYQTGLVPFNYVQYNSIQFYWLLLPHTYLLHAPRLTLIGKSRQGRLLLVWHRVRTWLRCPCPLALPPHPPPVPPRQVIHTNITNTKLSLSPCLFVRLYRYSVHYEKNLPLRGVKEEAGRSVPESRSTKGSFLSAYIPQYTSIYYLFHSMINWRAREVRSIGTYARNFLSAVAFCYTNLKYRLIFSDSLGYVGMVGVM